MSRYLVAVTALTPIAWGLTYLMTTELLPPDRPLLAATMRSLPVGLAFIAYGRHLPSGRWWARAALLGFFNIGAFFALLFVGAYRLPGGVAATAGAVQPLIAAGFAMPLLGQRFTPRTAVAGAVGVVGVGLLVLTPDAGLDPIGIAAALGGTVSMALGVVLTKRWPRPVDLVTFTGWQLTAGGLMLLPAALIIEGAPPSLSAANVAGFAWFAVIGTGLAYALWFRGIQALPVTTTSFLVLLSPLVATIAGWVALDQHLGPIQLVGAAAVLLAVGAAQGAGAGA